MESKHLEPHNPNPYAYLEPRLSKCPPLQLDSSLFNLNVNIKHDDDLSLDSALSTPSSVSTISPITPIVTRRSSCSSDPLSDSNDDLPNSHHNHPRARSTSSSSGKDPLSKEKEKEKEKKKRSRVTPDQLVHLERFFAHDRSPTAARRREISDLLGMQERQTQIWFQNRRAKAKLLDGRQKGSGGLGGVGGGMGGYGGVGEDAPLSPPDLAPGYEFELHNLIHEDEPVTRIICTDLSIGTWRRISTPSPSQSNDLVAYMSESKRCLTWFIHSAGYGFKMEIPFSIIRETHFAHAAPGQGLATFMLSHPPNFYMEDMEGVNNGVSGESRYWKRCVDWTEGRQASYVLRHDLIGSAVQLTHLLRTLSTYTQTQTTVDDVTLSSPAYATSASMSEPSSSPSPGMGMGMEIPQPPMAALDMDMDMEREREREREQSDPITASLEEQERRRRMSYSGPVTLSYPHPQHQPHPLYPSSSSSLISPSSSTSISSSTTSPMEENPYDNHTYHQYPKSAGAVLGRGFGQATGSGGNHVNASYSLTHPHVHPHGYGTSTPDGGAAISGMRRHSSASVLHHHPHQHQHSHLQQSHPLHQHQHQPQQHLQHYQYNQHGHQRIPTSILTTPYHPSSSPNTNNTHYPSPSSISPTTTLPTAGTGATTTHPISSGLPAVMYESELEESNVC